MPLCVERVALGWRVRRAKNAVRSQQPACREIHPKSAARARPLNRRRRHDSRVAKKKDDHLDR